MRKKAHLLVIGENGFERRALRYFLESTTDSCFASEAGDFGEAVDLLDQGATDMAVLLLPYDMESGISLLRNLRSRYPTLPILVLGSHREQVFAEEAVGAGATSYLLLNQAGRELSLAVQALCGGPICNATSAA